MGRIKIKIENSKITEGRDLLRRVVYTSPDGWYEVKLKKWSDDRSIQQNNLYWQWVDILAEYHGYTKQEMHEVFLEMFAPIQTIRSLDNKPIQKRVRTSQMTVAQMSEYMGHIDRHAAEFNIQLPRPEPEYA